MAFAPSKNLIFRGKLSFNKAYGANPTNTATNFPQRGYGFDTFDWVLNENLLDDKIRLKEAYWLYMSEGLFGSLVDWSLSFGRRPSTNGFLISLREGDEPSSPLGHNINVEFDGASFKLGLEKVSGISGMYWKACFGRGLTNARSRFNMDGGFNSLGDYTEDKNTLKNIDLAGFIFSAYDDGQYKVMTTWYRGFDVPGFVMADANMFTDAQNNSGMISMDEGEMMFNPKLQMQNMGDIDGGALSILVDGVGEGISDFFDETKLFASFGFSKTYPDNKISSLSSAMQNQVIQDGSVTNMQDGLNRQISQAITDGLAKEQVLAGMEQQMAGVEGMLGSNDDKIGTSYWFGMQIPAVITDEGIIGMEYNHGSKYWRPFTYGEDTLAGSKLAVRGDAYEIYYIQPLTEAFSMQLRYTKLTYDYTGSQGFFGAGGMPMTMAEAKAFGMDPIEEAEDIRLSFRYRF